MSIYFWLKILGAIALFCWPLTVMAAVGAYLLFVYGKSVPVPPSVSDWSALKKGDILLTGKPSTGYSWYIQLSNVLTGKAEQRFWTHAALYAGDGKVWEAQPEGVIERRLDDYFTNGFLVTALRHRYIENESVFDKALDFCARNRGTGYGGAGLVFYVLSTFVPVGMNFLFSNPWVDQWCKVDRAFFCSELIVDAFHYAGAPISAYDGWRVKPCDFIQNPLFENVTIKEPALC